MINILPFIGEKRAQQTPANIFFDSAIDLWLVMTGGLFENTGTMLNTSAFWIIGTKIEAPDSGKGDRLRAHGTRLQSYIEIAALEPRLTQFSASLLDYQKLCVRSHVVELLSTVSGSSEDITVYCIYEDCTDRDFTSQFGICRLVQSNLYITFLFISHFLKLAIVLP